jgi:hypothetical protein
MILLQKHLVMPMSETYDAYTWHDSGFLISGRSAQSILFVFDLGSVPGPGVEVLVEDKLMAWIIFFRWKLNF